MIHATRLIQHEIEYQCQKWGLEHDLKHHGSAGLAQAARIVASFNEPDTAGYYGDEWFFKLWHKNKHNPKKNDT